MKKVDLAGIKKLLQKNPLFISVIFNNEDTIPFGTMENGVLCSVLYTNPTIGDIHLKHQLSNPTNPINEWDDFGYLEINTIEKLYRVAQHNKNVLLFHGILLNDYRAFSFDVEELERLCKSGY